MVDGGPKGCIPLAAAVVAALLACAVPRWGGRAEGEGQACPPDARSWAQCGGLDASEGGLGRGKSGAAVNRLELAEWQRRFLRDYHLRSPVILRGWGRARVSGLRARTERHELLGSFGSLQVLTATPSELASGGQRKARTSERLADYVRSMPGHTYLFDDGGFMRTSGLDKDWQTLPGLDALGTFSSWDANSTTSITGIGDALAGPALTFALGGPAQGVAFHVHGDSYSVQLHGRKHWAVYAPGNMTATGYSRSESFGEWSQTRRAGARFSPPTWECILEEGEALYIPEGFAHGTACIGHCVALVHQTEALHEGSAFHSFVQSRRAGTKTDAWHSLRRAVQFDATNSDYWLELGVAYAEFGRLPDAEVCFRHALLVNPLNGDARRNLAGALARSFKPLLAVGVLSGLDC